MVHESGHRNKRQPGIPMIPDSTFARAWRCPHVFSSIRTMTVGSGFSPDLLDLCPSWTKRSRAPRKIHRDTAGGEFHPALRIKLAAKYPRKGLVSTIFYIKSRSCVVPGRETGWLENSSATFLNCFKWDMLIIN